jgi:hypothetical protein
MSDKEQKIQLTGIEAEVHEIRQEVAEIAKKPDILSERETLGIMKLSEKVLYKFLDEEPDLYSVS